MEDAGHGLESGASPAVEEVSSPLKITPAQRGRAAMGVALILISAAGYGTQAIFARLAYAAGVNVATLLLLRFLLSIALLWLILLLRGRWQHARHVLSKPKLGLRLLALGIIFAGNSAAQLFSPVPVQADQRHTPDPAGYGKKSAARGGGAFCG